MTRKKSGDSRPADTSAQAIAAEIDRADTNLKNLLDRLTPQFEADHSAFTAAYTRARKIVQTGGGGETAATPAPPEH